MPLPKSFKKGNPKNVIPGICGQGNLGLFAGQAYMADIETNKSRITIRYSLLFIVQQLSFAFGLNFSQIHLLALSSTR